MTLQASVIVPAHDEEGSLAPSLRTLLVGIPAGALEVVVVANGCGDRTADAAREIGAELAVDITVVEVPTPSKTFAMNVGDSVATAFPRLYLDADVQCPPSTLRSMIGALQVGGSELAVPTRRLDLSSATWWVSQYYRTWQRLPRVRAELSGRGVYAFSRAGRERFDHFPSIIADDHWAVRQVPADRAVVVPEEAVIRPPMDLRSLVRVRSRIYAANQATRAERGERSPWMADLRYLAGSARRWVGAGVFLSTNAYIKLIGVRRHPGYGRDTARGAGQPKPPSATAAHAVRDRTDDRAV